MTPMNIEMSSKFLGIMVILSNLQGVRDQRVEDQTNFFAKGKERADNYLLTVSFMCFLNIAFCIPFC